MVNTLAFLRDNPQFQAIRAMVQGNPSILQPMLGELQRQNPQLYHLINSNQEEFLQLLNEPSDFEAPGMGEDEMEQIELTKEENEACERLMALGFSMERAWRHTRVTIRTKRWRRITCSRRHRMSWASKIEKVGVPVVSALPNK